MTLREVFLALMVLLLLGVLLWLYSGGRAHNFLSPTEPFFEGAPRALPVASGTPSPHPSGRFTVASFNVHFGYEAAQIAPTLIANNMADADIVLLQESNETTAGRVSAALGIGYAYYPAAIHPTSRDLFGVAILSRWPIVAHRKILLPDKSAVDGARKVGMVAVVNVDGVPIKVVCVHLQSGMLESGYKDQLKSLVECVTENDCHDDKDPAPLPDTRALIFGGDFNTWTTSLQAPLEKRMAKVGMKRVEGIERTFAKTMEKDPKTRHTFDYFYATPEIIAGPGRVGKDRTGSDHWPIAAEFLLPAK